MRRDGGPEKKWTAFDSDSSPLQSNCFAHWNSCASAIGVRKKKDFGLSDLIAAFDAETHENTVEFVRIWMKRPGVPEEFRARYQEPAAATAQSEKETAP
jgi:hypothetical protein